MRRGHRVCVITTRRKGEPALEQWEGVTIHRVFTAKAYGFYQGLPSVATVRAIFEREKPDLVHHHYVGFMMRQVCRVAESLQLRQVSTYHFGAEVLTQPAVLKKLEDLGIVYHKMTQAEYAALVASQISEWAPIIKASGAKL